MGVFGSGLRVSDADFKDFLSAPYAEIENENINTIVYFSADCFQQVLRCGIPAISRDIGKNTASRFPTTRF